MDISFNQKETTSEIESTKQAIGELPESNQANIKLFVEGIVRANEKVVEKRLFRIMNHLNSDGNTGSRQSKLNSYKR